MPHLISIAPRYGLVPPFVATGVDVSGAFKLSLSLTTWMVFLVQLALASDLAFKMRRGAAPIAI